MACEQEQQLLERAVSEIEAFARAEADDLRARAESETAQVGAQLEDDSDIAQVIGTSVGAAVGGAVSGGTGTVTGALIGKEIGKLFVIDIEMRRVSISIDVPQFKIEQRRVSFDLPTVTIRNRDVIFHVPDVRMKRVKTGENPETTCSGGSVWPPRPPSCTVRWTPIYIDIPEPYMKEMRVVIGIPETRMDARDILFDVPTAAMKRQEWSMEAPAVTVRSRYDAAERAKAEADLLSSKFKSEAAVLAARVKERAKERLVPRVSAVFSCHRAQIERQIVSAPQQFDPGIAAANSALDEMKRRGVPADDDDYLQVRRARDDLIARREALVTSLQQAIENLNAAERQAVGQLLSS